MKYEDVQKLRTKYRQDPEVINVEYMRDVAISRKRLSFRKDWRIYGLTT